MRLIRNNKMGLVVTFDTICGAENKGKTLVECNGNKLTIAMPIEELVQAWYNWQVKGDYIQIAFPRLNDAEREFLMTGITQEKWKEIFGEEE